MEKTITKINLNEVFKGKEYFILQGVKKVKDFKDAEIYGGVTKIQNEYFSNIEKDFMEIEDIKNIEYKILVPTTLNINEIIDNSKYVEKIEKTLNHIGYKTNKINSSGSWYSDTLNKIVVEDNTIIKFNSSFNLFTIKLLEALAIELKKDMLQEGISIWVNDGLIII